MNELKSAEEWAKEWIGPEFSSGSSLVRLFKQIQLNAYKAGMTEAADIARREEYPMVQNKIIHRAAHAIRSARDRKETI